MFNRDEKISSSALEVKPEDINPQAPEDYIYRGWLYYNQKDYAKAEGDYLKAIELQPDEPDTYFALALSQKYHGLLDDSVQSFKIVISLADKIESKSRATMIKRLSIGHINDITQGDWNLEKEVWEKKL